MAVALFSAQSIAANATSGAMDIKDHPFLGVQLHSASAARGGTVSFQISNDGTNWNTVEFYYSGSYVTTLTITAASAFDEHVDLELYAEQFRVVFTDVATGAGTLDAIVSVKPRG